MVDCWQSHISRTVHQHSQKEASLLAEIEKLKQCNKELQKSLARESEITNKSEKSLISGVAELLSQFVSQKESRMGSIFSNVQTELNHRADGLRVILEDENHGQVRLTQDFEQLKTESIDALDKLCVKVEQDKEVCFFSLVDVKPNQLIF